jgi:hypothetical protein
MSNLTAKIQAHQDAFLRAYLSVRNDSSLVQRMPAYGVKNRLFDLVWSIYQLQHFGHGKASEASRKSMETYERNYASRRDALEKICLQMDTLPDSNLDNRGRYKTKARENKF